jgi:glucose-6-phosphate-specific signal transduction histidine kinase
VRGVKENGRLSNALCVAIVATFILVGRPRLSLYSVQELVTFLLGIAILLILLSAIVIAFFFSWQGAKLGLFRLKAVFSRIASVRARPIRAGQAIQRSFRGR